MKPAMNPALIRSLLTAVGLICTTVATLDDWSWQTVLATVGGALVGWMRRAPNHVDAAELPLGMPRRMQ